MSFGDLTERAGTRSPRAVRKCACSEVQPTTKNEMWSSCTAVSPWIRSSVCARRGSGTCRSGYRKKWRVHLPVIILQWCTMNRKVKSSFSAGRLNLWFQTTKPGHGTARHGHPSARQDREAALTLVLITTPLMHRSCSMADTQTVYFPIFGSGRIMTGRKLIYQAQGHCHILGWHMLQTSTRWSSLAGQVQPPHLHRFQIKP